MIPRYLDPSGKRYTRHAPESWSRTSMNKCLNIIIVADSGAKGTLTCQSRKLALAMWDVSSAMVCGLLPLQGQ